jgi:hypothetical protein
MNSSNKYIREELQKRGLKMAQRRSRDKIRRKAGSQELEEQV